jgi:molybdate transport system permease protein
MVRAIRLSIEAVDRQLEEAAKTLGAGPVSVFLVITLPLSVPGIASMILCFARSMGEFGVTITFVSNIPGETQTLPSAIFTLTQVPGGDAAALRLTLISIMISCARCSPQNFLPGASFFPAASEQWCDGAEKRAI